MIIEAVENNGIVECKYEAHLECASCGAVVDALEFKAEVCNDCGNSWTEKRHTAVHVTSIPMSGQTL